MLLAYIQKEGLATINEIRDFYPEVRIIAMSGGMWAMDKSRTLQLAKGPSLPVDHFSARWTRSVSLPAGRWRFHAASDDGVRVVVDGLPIIDQWHTTAAVTYNTSAALSGGNHNLRVDYYDNTEKAGVRVWWEPDDGSATDPGPRGRLAGRLLQQSRSIRHARFWT